MEVSTRPDYACRVDIAIGAALHELSLPGAIKQPSGIDLGDSLFSEWSGRPVVVATAVTPAAQ